MPAICGIEYGPATEALLEQARAELTPRVLQFAHLRDAPPELGAIRQERGAFVEDIPAIYLNTDREDTSEDTLAHELGHAILYARGWPTIEWHPEIDAEMGTGMANLLHNRLQHIAMVPILRSAGFDRTPGYALRADRDIAQLEHLRGQGSTPDDPGLIVPFGVRHAEMIHAADAATRGKFRSALRRLCPSAERLGSDLARATEPARLRTPVYIRRGILRWMDLIDSAVRQTRTPGAVLFREALAIVPVPLSNADLAAPAQSRVAMSVRADPQAADVRHAVIRWKGDKAIWGFRRIRIREMTLADEQRFMDAQIRRPLREFASWLNLPFAVL